ncbi:hypothetical protein AVEN_223643-1 [Araneus ventricosus]|uniref:Uncharacterized protein n=1 Tax=Araneus ventricosus TaxID=182803 RepID=A0A4Y2JRD2_ARAVE|nr:hypothetical protein AVEN_223643-1 [Araneus ventricosus]
MSLAKIMGLELDNNNIDDLLEEHSQELTTEEFTELHCVSQQENVEEEKAPYAAEFGWIRASNLKSSGHKAVTFPLDHHVSSAIASFIASANHFPRPSASRFFLKVALARVRCVQWQQSTDAFLDEWS